MRWLALALALGACSAAEPAALPITAAVTAPDELKSCPLTPTAVSIPKPPRSFDSVIAWANATEAQRAKTVQALEICRYHLEQLLSLYEAPR